MDGSIPTTLMPPPERPPDPSKTSGKQSRTKKRDTQTSKTKKYGKSQTMEDDNDDKMSVAYSVSTQNSFTSLTDDDLGDMMHLKKKNREIKIKKPPPVVLRNLDPQFVSSKLQGLTLDNNNISRRITKNGTKLYVTNNE